MNPEKEPDYKKALKQAVKVGKEIVKKDKPLLDMLADKPSCEHETDICLTVVCRKCGKDFTEDVNNKAFEQGRLEERERIYQFLSNHPDTKGQSFIEAWDEYLKSLLAKPEKEDGKE